MLKGESLLIIVGENLLVVWLEVQCLLVKVQEERLSALTMQTLLSEYAIMMKIITKRFFLRIFTRL